MWGRSNWCERVIIFSLGTVLFLLFSNLFFQPTIYNVWLFIYTVSLIVLSIWVTCRDIKFLLEQSTPLKTEPKDDISSKHSKINIISSVIPIFKKILTLKDLRLSKNEIEQRQKAMHISSCSDISTIASVIERKFVWAWYSQYVSKEIAFPFACKELLDQMVTKIFQISPNVDTVSLCSDSLGIILRHCKEYKRASKRLEITGKGRIEEYYRNSHPTSAQRNSLTTSTKGKSTQSHCLLLTRAFLKELLPWELWGTPHAMLLASILAKRLHSFLSTDLSNPIWLRHNLSKLLETSALKSVVNTPITPAATPVKTFKEKELLLVENDFVKPKSISHTPIIEIKKDISAGKYDHSDRNVEEIPVIKTSIESALSNLISNTTAPILQRDIEKVTTKPITNIVPPVNYPLLQEGKESKIGAISILKKPSQPIDIKGSPSHSLNGQESHSLSAGKAKSCEVKIYDKVVDGSVRTWNNDVDLECVSLGQDLLASLDGEIGFESRLGRLWEADGADSSEAWSPNPPSTGSSIKTPYLWGEEDTLDMDLTEESPPRNMVQTNISHSISNFNINKPLSIHNMKELQNISKNTVNQAKHKIGDLQDEAAGMMEGILDFGMAGLRKGLRLTGLQESLQEKASMTHMQKPSTESMSGALVSTLGQALTASRKNSQSDDGTMKADVQKVTLVTKDIDINSEVRKSQQSIQPIPLLKQQHVISQDNSYVGSIIRDREKDQSREQLLDLPISIAIEPAITGTESPDYEYEEAADFASTIAKLRSLLQQKTGDVTPISQDDGALLHLHDNKLATLSKPASATQPNNSPVHRPVTVSQKVPERTQRSTDQPEIASIPSFESENGFTILNQHNSTELFEAEEALNHKVGSVATAIHVQPNGNNMQRLDKLFTRTVTGVFNTIKTAVGGDSLADAVAGYTETSGGGTDKLTVVRAHQHKDDWIFVEGNVDVSILVSKLLVERRGFCVVEVEAAQDSLEVLVGSKHISTSSHLGNTQGATNSSTAQDDLDESELISGCPLYHMCMELVSVILGGSLQKDAVVKCTSVAMADMVEEILRENLNTLNSWLRDFIIGNFRNLSKHWEGTPVKIEVEEPLQDVLAEQISDALIQKIPDVLFTLFGREEIAAALKMLISSIENPLINRDVMFNLLDVAMLHFLKACLQPSYMTTPPPSA